MREIMEELRALFVLGTVVTDAGLGEGGGNTFPLVMSMFILAGI